MSMFLDNPALIEYASFGRTLLELFWVPLFAWTIVALGSWLILRSNRTSIEVGLWTRVGLILSLPVSLLLGVVLTVEYSGRPVFVAESVVYYFAGADAAIQAQAATKVAQADYLGLLSALVVVAILVLGVSRLALELVSWYRQYRFASSDVCASDSHFGRVAQQVASTLGVSRRFSTHRIASDLSPMLVPGPVARLVLPAFLEGDNENLRLAIVHELTHLKRYDDVSFGVVSLVHALFAWNPIVNRLYDEAMDLLELSVDSEVVRLEPSQAGRYAELLVTTACKPANVYSALTMSREGDFLKQRIKNMKTTSVESTARRMALLGSSIALVAIMSVGFVACSDVASPDIEADQAGESANMTLEQRIQSQSLSIKEEQLALQELIRKKEAGEGPANIDQLIAEKTEVVETAKRTIGKLLREKTASMMPERGKYSLTDTFVVVADPPSLVGGLASVHARAASENTDGCEGRVTVQFVVDTDGTVAKPVVLKGIAEHCDQAALNMVSAAEFTPGMQDGTPVKVKMSLPILFRSK